MHHHRVRRLFRRFRSGPYPRLPSGHVSQSPPTIPDGRISRVRFWPRLCTPFLRAGLPPRRETAVLAHPSPRRGGVCIAPSPRRRPRVIQLCVWCVPTVVATECPEPLCPERALPAPGRPRKPPGGALPPRRRSYGLMRQTTPLPAPPVFPLCARSLQVVASPCWAMALPDIISATLVQVLGPIPRRAPRLHLSIPSPRTPASPHGKRVRRADLSPHGSFRGEPYFVAAVIRSPSGSCTRSASRLLRPQRASAGPPGLSHHASPGRLPEPGCGVASRPTWTTDVAGLSPAGSQPCRLLPPAHGSPTPFTAGIRLAPLDPPVPEGAGGDDESVEADQSHAVR